jgi:hypothetical protein
MPVARRSNVLVRIRLFRLFALTAAPLAVELFAPALSTAHAAEATPSSTTSSSAAKSTKPKKESKAPAHRHRATAIASEANREAHESRHSTTDVKVDVHIDGNKRRVASTSGNAEMADKAEKAADAVLEAKPGKKKDAIVDVEVEPSREQHARRAPKDLHVGRGDHAVEPEHSPKIEAALDPTIHFVPMSATTLSPIDVSVDVKTSDKPETKRVQKRVDIDDGIAPQLLHKIEDKPIDKGSDKSDKKSPKNKKAEKTCLSSAIDVMRGVEEEKIALTKCDGELAPGALERMSILVRPSSASRPIASLDELIKSKGPDVAPGVKRIDGALVSHLERVIEHFSKTALKKDETPRVFVISGYRPGSKGSFHQSGKALDFRIDGVKNEELVAYCKTLSDVGCGYYPNSSFVHMDVRAPGTGHVAWIDASGPGESPDYVAAWPIPADKKGEKKDSEEAIAKNDAEPDGTRGDAAPVDAKASKSTRKHVGIFDMPPLPAEEHAADPEAISDMAQPAADVAVPNDE